MGARKRTKVVAFIAASVFALCGIATAASLNVSSSTITTMRTCTLAPQSAASSAGADAWVNQNSTAQNNGTAATLSVQSRNNQNQRIYIRFDLAQCNPVIPAGATIDSAKVRMLPSAVANQCRTYDIFRVTSAWTESGLGGITWLTQPFGTTLNNPAQASRTAFSTIGAAPCENTSTANFTLGWDVTNDVRAFMTGTTNNGWMIRDDVEQSGNQLRTTTFYARDTGGVAAPELIVDYRT